MCWYDLNDKISLWVKRKSTSKIYRLFFASSHISYHNDGWKLWLNHHWNMVHGDSLLLISYCLYSVRSLRLSQAVRTWHEQRSTLACHVTSYHNSCLLLRLMELSSYVLCRVRLFRWEWKIKTCKRIRSLGFQNV